MVFEKIYTVLLPVYKFQKMKIPVLIVVVSV